ncbi:P-loop NTPase [Streptomyces niveus]|uniref:P-loop NTPase n=1 Tax=Streptomyces niveus TaxID=193462 RepID=UPI00363C67EF
MTAHYEDLIDRLEQGPSFLLLGQKYLRLESGEDPLVGPVSRAADGLISPRDLYQLLLRIPRERREAVLAALSRSASELTAPAWLDVVSSLPWNGVFSTAVDSLFLRALRNKWRQVQPVASSSYRPSAPRSTSQVQAVLLFGGADQPPENQPPTNRLELGARKSEARALAQRLPDELITPRGVLVIEAWGVNDWFSSEDLYGVVHRLGRAQAHLFSATSAELEDEYIAAAIEEGTLVTHTEDFASYVEDARRRGRLTDLQRFDSGGHQIRHGRELYEVPRDIWNAVASFGQPVDVDLLAAPPVQSRELRYLRFREFLGTTESSSIWSSISSGLPFRRDYEAALRERVEAALSSRGVLERPLLLRGQTGSGKTIALASLAHSIARDGQHAVLHIPRRANRPSFEAIDSFCQWAEKVTIPTTLLVWDGMVDPDEYFRLAKYLDSRGRRAVLVGSCYRTDDFKKTSQVIEAPSSLSSGEMERFSHHLESLGISIPDRVKIQIQKDSTFLSALYRLLPESRGPVSGGLVLELRHTETALASAIRTSSDYAPPTAMAAALAKVGLIDSLETALREMTETSEEPAQRGPYERLVNIVLVASQHGQSIPLELALRVVGRDGVRNLPQLLGRVDLIRWLEDHDGNYTLSARNELEAQILVTAEQTSGESEIKALADVLSEVRPDSTSFGGGEVQFAVDLLNRVGPQGDQVTRYAQHFLRIADAIAQANGASVVPNPRLALLEANLCRKWVKYAQRERLPNVDQRAQVLERAESVVEEALTTLSPSSRLGVRASLMVEQASVAGAKIYELLRSGPNGSVPSPLPADTVNALVNRVLRITSDSMRHSTDKYYPVDVLCWVTSDVFDKNGLPQHEATMLLSECISRLLLIDVADLSPKQESKYNARFADIAGIARDDRVADERLQELAKHDEPLAAYLYALRVSGLIRNAPDPAGILTALTHLQTHEAAVNDRRCLRLLVDLFWLTKTGHRFMGGERLTLPLTPADWSECLDVAGRLQAADELSLLRVEFMRALALFHLGQMAAAFASFRKADQQSHAYRRRIVTMYLASAPSGNPEKFHPVVRRVDPDQRKGVCWVEELAREVAFQPYDFGITDPSPGLALPDAYVAFNLRGPILEPARQPGDRRGPNIVSSINTPLRSPSAGSVDN